MLKVTTPVPPGLPGGQHPFKTENERPRLSGMALFSFLCGWGILPILFLVDAVSDDSAQSCLSGNSGELAPLFIFVPLLSAAAFVTWWGAMKRIEDSQGRVKGLWLANLGLAGGIVNLLAIMSTPMLLAQRDNAVVERGLKTLHQAEE